MAGGLATYFLKERVVRQATVPVIAGFPTERPPPRGRATLAGLNSVPDTALTRMSRPMTWGSALAHVRAPRQDALLTSWLRGCSRMLLLDSWELRYGEAPKDEVVKKLRRDWLLRAAALDIASLHMDRGGANIAIPRQGR